MSVETPTLVFPETLTDLNTVDQRLYVETFGFTPGTLHDTDIEEAFDGSEQRRARFVIYGLGTAVYRTMRLDIRQSGEFKAFLLSARGRAVSFWFTNPDEEFWPNKLVGVADGTDHLDINLRDGHDWTDVKVGGVTFPDHAYVLGGGAYGQDALAWTGTYPTVGQNVEIFNIYAREVFKMRLDNDRVIREPWQGGDVAELGIGAGATNPRLFVQYLMTMHGLR